MFHPRIGSDRDLAAVAVEGAVEGMSIKFHADDISFRFADELEIRDIEKRFKKSIETNDQAEGLAGQGRSPLFFISRCFCGKAKCHSRHMYDIVTL